MPIKLNDFINESLNDPHDYVQTFDVPGYVLGQYEFEHNGTLFAVRFTSAPKYGKRVSNVEFGRKVNKKVSKKLPKITSVRKFLATVVAIIKYHVVFNDNPKAQNKMSGFALNIPEDDLKIVSGIVGLALKKLFKTFVIYPHYNENIYDPEKKVILIHRFTKSAADVFDKIDLSNINFEDDEDQYLDPPLNSTMSDSGLDDEELFKDPFETDPEPEVSDNSADVYGDTIQGDDAKEDVMISDGIYKNNQGKHILVNDNGDGTSKVWIVNSSNMKVTSPGTNLINDMLVDADVKLAKWQTNIWFTEFEPFTTPILVYSLMQIPDTVFAIVQGETKRFSLQDVVNGNTVFGRAIPQYEGREYPRQGTGIFIAAADNDVSPFGLMDLENVTTNPHADYIDSFANKTHVIVELNANQIQGFLDKFPENKFIDETYKKMKEIVSDGDDQGNPNYQPAALANPFPDDVDFSHIPKLTDKWPDINRWIEKSSIRTEENQPSSVSLADGMIQIDYEDDILEIRKKFDRLKTITGGDQTKIKNMLREYMRTRSGRAYKFTKRVSVLQNEDPDLAYTKDDLDLLSTYTGSGYKTVNTNLRDNEPMKPGSFGHDFVEGFDEMFQNKGIQLPKGLIMYRGQSNSDQEIYDFIEGKEVEFAAYVSCTMSPGVAANFTKTGGNELDYIMPEKDRFSSFYVQDYENRKRNKIMMSIKDAHKIPVLVPGGYSNVPNESEIILPRGTKLVADSDITPVHERIYVGTFRITGIRGLDTLLESSAFKKFKMFCEEQTATENHVKEMIVDVMIVDYLDDVDRDPEELENLQNFFQRMASQA